MGKKFTEIAIELQNFIKKQKIFFVGTAAEKGNVNVSPKGMDSFRVINSKKIVWLNLTESGNETAAHLLKNNRMTILFSAFEGKPMILRLYGTAKIYHQRDTAYQDYIGLFPKTPGSRQIIEMEVDLVQTSCGYAIPLMDYKEDRTVLKDWSTHKGEEGIYKYWKEQNTKSIDGFETNILSD